MTVPLNDEQEVMVAICVRGGATKAEAEAAVRAEPMLATVLGSGLIPPLTQIAEATIRLERSLADWIDELPNKEKDT